MILFNSEAGKIGLGDALVKDRAKFKNIVSPPF